MPQGFQTWCFLLSQELDCLGPEKLKWSMHIGRDPLAELVLGLLRRRFRSPLLPGRAAWVQEFPPRDGHPAPNQAKCGQSNDAWVNREEPSWRRRPSWYAMYVDSRLSRQCPSSSGIKAWSRICAIST